MENIKDRFLRYVAVDTQSDESSDSQPSAKKELILLEMLRDELRGMGVSAELDQWGYVMASIPANTDAKVPAIGFIAHVDTSPDAPGNDIRPQIIENYDGTDIPPESGNFLSDRFNSKRGSAVDWQFGAQVGVTFRIGLKKNRRHAAAEPVSVAPSVPVGAVQQEPQPRQPEPQVKEEPAPAAPVAVPEVKEYRDNVYFLIGKYCIRESESVKISAIAAMLKENPLAVVKITGYADAQTGTAGRNMYLSRKRAEAVAAAIIEAGISADRIRTEYKGSTEAPFGSPEENRVAVCVVSGQEQ